MQGLHTFLEAKESEWLIAKWAMPRAVGISDTFQWEY